MTASNKKLKITGAILLAFLLGLIIVFQVAGRILKEQVIEALGPDSELTSIHPGLTGVVVEGLRIRGPKDWPAEDALRAKRVVIRPDLFALFTGTYRIGAITIEEAYLSVLRAKPGRIRVLPSLLEQPADKAADKTQPKTEVPKILIGQIKLKDSALEFFDATLRKPPFKLRLEQLQLKVSDLEIPQLSMRTEIALDGVIKGVQHDGEVSIKGWIVPATQDSSITTRLNQIDLVALEPYLIKASETGVQSGSLNLEVQSDVRKKQLQAPGQATLSRLKLAPGGTSFMGVPRNMVVGLLKNDQDQINVKFKLEGDLNNPQFSLNETLSTRLTTGMAEAMGLSLSGLAGGVGMMGQKGAQATGNAVKDVGSAIGGLFTDSKKK